MSLTYVEDSNTTSQAIDSIGDTGDVEQNLSTTRTETLGSNEETETSVNMDKPDSNPPADSSNTTPTPSNTSTSLTNASTRRETIKHLLNRPQW